MCVGVKINFNIEGGVKMFLNAVGFIWVLRVTKAFFQLSWGPNQTYKEMGNPDQSYRETRNPNQPYRGIRNFSQTFREMRTLTNPSER